MVTKEQALTRRMFHYTGNHPCTRTVGPRGCVTTKVTMVRASGLCKTWVTRPEHFQLPVKHGLRDSAYITHDNAEHWHTDEECPLYQD